MLSSTESETTVMVGGLIGISLPWKESNCIRARKREREKEREKREKKREREREREKKRERKREREKERERVKERKRERERARERERERENIIVVAVRCSTRERYALTERILISLKSVAF